jgi:hypothetical protein
MEFSNLQNIFIQYKFNLTHESVDVFILTSMYKFLRSNPVVVIFGLFMFKFWQISFLTGSVAVAVKAITGTLGKLARILAINR